jgi:hypothetical protein
MKHESIVVVYDSCQAIAEDIADKLGAETISVQSVNMRQVENSKSFVLAVEFQPDGHLTPHWEYACQMFCGSQLNGKNFAVFVALGNMRDRNATNDLCDEFRKNHARVVGNHPVVGSLEWDLDNWICTISPNL